MVLYTVLNLDGNFDSIIVNNNGHVLKLNVKQVKGQRREVNIFFVFLSTGSGLCIHEWKVTEFKLGL